MGSERICLCRCRRPRRRHLWEEAKRVVRDRLQLPVGYALQWSGQYESMERVRQRLVIVLPLTLFLILMLLYLNTRSLTKTFLIVLCRPLFGSRRNLAGIPARVQHVDRSVGWAHCVDGCRCRNGRVHAPLSGSGVRGSKAARQTSQLG